MIICPTCKEEIDDDSRYCDQCGQALLYCNQCGRVGVGRRCTYCGGLMVVPGKEAQQAQMESVASVGYATYGSIRPDDSRSGAQGGMPVLTLANDSLNIRIVAMNGAIIGRRSGVVRGLIRSSSRNRLMCRVFMPNCYSNQRRAGAWLINILPTERS